MSAREIPEMLLLGVGSGGCRIAYAVRKAYGAGIRVICADTDAMTGRKEPLEGLTTLLLGGSRLSGQGSGGDAIQGRFAAQDDLTNLAAHLQGVRTVVLVTCLGAGTGGGATPEIVKYLHDTGVTTLCFVTLPFSFEGEERKALAKRVQPCIEENADSIVIVPQDDLFADTGKDKLDEAIKGADAILIAGLTLLWRSLTSPGFIRLDPERLHHMIIYGGNASLGSASAADANRAVSVVKALGKAALLKKGDALKKANAVLLGILAGSDLRLAEIGELMNQIRSVCGASCRIEMGTVLDEQFNGRIELVLLAFQSWKAAAVEKVPVPTPVAAPSSPSAPSVEPPVGTEIPIQTGGRRHRSGSKLGFGPNGKGRFQNMEPTLENGQDLDVPAYVRRGITLER